MIDVHQLKPGDRVVVNSPRGDGRNRRIIAQFEGIVGDVLTAIAEAAAQHVVVGVDTYYAGSIPRGPFAVFLLDARMHGAFQIQPDGTMRDDVGHAVYVEKRLGRVGVG